MIPTYVSAYPWDLLDGDALDVLHGEVGVAGIATWAVLPPVLRFRWAEVTPRIVRTRGGTCFKPADACYQSTRLKPMVADGLHGKNQIETIADRCAALGLQLRLMLSATRLPRVAERHPEFTAKNVFGDPSHERLCIANPDVRSYLSALVGELATRFKPPAIILSDLQSRWAEADTEGIFPDKGVSPTAEGGRDLLQFLLGLCFCESCRQGAGSDGIDVPGAVRCATVMVNRDAQESKSQAESALTKEDVLAANQPLAAYVAWQRCDRVRLIEALTVASGSCGLIIECDDSRADASGPPTPDPTKPRTILRITDAQRLSSTTTFDAHETEIAMAAELLTGQSPDQVVAVLARAMELGVSGVTFEDYGALCGRALTGLRQGVRFVRRSPDD